MNLTQQISQKCKHMLFIIFVAQGDSCAERQDGPRSRSGGGFLHTDSTLRRARFGEHGKLLAIACSKYIKRSNHICFCSFQFSLRIVWHIATFFNSNYVILNHLTWTLSKHHWNWFISIDVNCSQIRSNLFVYIVMTFN